MKLINIPCLLCTESTLTPVLQKESYTLVECNRCHLAFINPRIQEVEEVYKENKIHTQYYEHTTACDEVEFSRRLNKLKKFCSGGKVLDVGCATGSFLKLATERGFDVYGVEVNEYSAQISINAGFKVHKGLLQQDSFPTNFFDLVHMSDSIEHMENPLETLQLCTSFMKPGGYIMITTPDWDSSWARRFQIKPTDHLYYFTQKTLGMLIGKAGLEQIESYPINRVRDLKALEYSTSIDPGLLAKAFFFGVSLMPGKSLCVRLPFKDDILMLARKPV